MKALKTFLGVLAILFVVFHLIEIPGMVRGEPGRYAASAWLGKVAAILIGTAIAISLFRSTTKKPK
jgi:hypothetical protein